MDLTDIWREAAVGGACLDEAVGGRQLDELMRLILWWVLAFSDVVSLLALI